MIRRSACLAAALFLAPPPICAAPLATADEAALRALGAAYVAAWGRADAAGLAGFFAADGDLVIPSGLAERGRAAIRRFYAQAFAGGYAGSRGQFEIVGLRRLDARLVLLDLTWSITGAHDAAGAARPVQRGIAVAVAVKTAAGWRIAALREQAGAQAITTADP